MYDHSKQPLHSTRKAAHTGHMTLTDQSNSPMDSLESIYADRNTWVGWSVVPGSDSETYHQGESKIKTFLSN